MLLDEASTVRAHLLRSILVVSIAPRLTAMRYQKGSIGLNDFRDKPILRFVAESRYIGHSQLWRFSRTAFAEFNRQVFNWRIRRLVRGGLVRRQVVPFLDGEALYSITGRGIQALERLGVYYLGADLNREKELHEFQIPHALELNAIRLALMRTYEFSSWIPESFIRVLNLSPATAYAKVYDGIARVRLTGGSIEFAVEYERTLKSQAKYEKIREVIESEKRLSVFLYLLPTNELLSSLRHEFWRTKRQVLFGLVDEFKESVFQAPLTTAMYDRTSLQEALTQACALAKPPT